MPKHRIKLQRDVVLPRVIEEREFWLCVIAIEGEKTEKQYFRKFGNAKVKVDILPTLSGDSTEPESIIERLRKYKQDNDIREDDQCWLVFDVDDRSDERLKTVCVQAREERFQVAISNPCFEFWLFLHKFEPSELNQLNPKIHAVPPEKRPSEMKLTLGLYCAEHSFSYREFRNNVEKAIQRAKTQEEGRNTPYPRFPGTDVYKVVESLPLTSPEDKI